MVERGNVPQLQVVKEIQLSEVDTIMDVCYDLVDNS